MLPVLSSASVKKKAQQVKMSSNMRQIAVAFSVYTHSGARMRYQPEKYQDIEALLEIFTQVELFDASIFLSPYDLKHARTKAPEIIGYTSETGKIEFVPDILEFPIAYSFAVYPDLARPSSMTPLLWTRGLHNYESFDAPYGGHIAYLDGHVTYYSGEPGQHDPELVKIFGAGSEFSKAVRIIEHEPEGWTEEKLTPLPVRIAEATKPNPFALVAAIAGMCAPALIAAFLVGLLPKPTMRERLWSASIAFGIVLIATLIFLPAVFC
jgi:prepilin-type processing-associated H-X9-DG protein